MTHFTQHGTFEEKAFATGRASDLSPVIGEAVWVLGASDRYRSMTVDMLRACVFEPILHQQCIVFQKHGAPIAAAFWAVQVEGWRAPTDGLLSMTRADWRAGSVPTLVDIIAPFGDEEQFRNSADRRLKHEIALRHSA